MQRPSCGPAEPTCPIAYHPYAGSCLDPVGARTAHGKRMDTCYWGDYGDLHLRDPETLTADERSSLEYLDGFFDELHGYTRGTQARRWFARRRQVIDFAHAHGRLPVPGDSELPVATHRWLAAVRRDELNSFQRLMLERIPGWAWD